MASKRKTTKQSKKESPDANELLVLELQEIFSAETQLARVMPRITKAVETETLREMFEERLAEGERVLKDVESAIDELEASPGRKKNVAAEGLINDLREHVQELQRGPALDSVLLAGIQKTEHYCIAAWGTVRSLGQALGQNALVKSMERALKEGKAYDERLTQLAEQEITPELMSIGMEEDEEEETSGSSRSRKNGGGERRSAN